MFAVTGLFLGNPTQESGWFSLNLENLNTNILFDLDNLTEEIPNLGSIFLLCFLISRVDHKTLLIIQFQKLSTPRCEISLFGSSRSLKTREHSFAQFIYFLRKVCLSFKN